MTSQQVVVAPFDRGEVEAFLFHEARLQDEHRYTEWEALWTDDALYWVPASDGADADSHVSVIYDNRNRIATRIRQLTSGHRYAQAPPSRLRRIVSNVECAARADDECDAAANFLIHELRRGSGTLWSGRTEYRLRRVDGELRLVSKKVLLTNASDDLPTLAFLI